MDIIIHASDSSFGNAVMIDTWHAQRGFKNSYGVHIGYHLVVLNGQLTYNKYNRYFDGLVETGRAFDDDDKFEWDETAAATLGANNKIQICLIGKSGAFTVMQWDGLREAIGIVKKVFKKITSIKQHSDYEPKKPFCAGIPPSLMEELRKEFCD